jgi:hypothetical protein
VEILELSEVEILVVLEVEILEILEIVVLEAEILEMDIIPDTKIKII